MRMVWASDLQLSASPNGERLRSVFGAPAPPTLGLEEELMLLDPVTLDLAPRAAEVIDGLDGRFALELPASQLEIIVPASATVREAVGHLAQSRADLARHTELRLAGAGLHPFAATEGELNRSARYDTTVAEHGRIAHRQLVHALQVHVAIRGADRALAVHNALRSHLPELAALAGNAPFYGGRDTGLASARPPVSSLLPRQGIPPILSSWDAYARALELVGDPSRWWWELRPHPAHGTLEIRVPDAQPTVADAAAIAAVAHCLPVWLADRHDAGETLPADESWRIAENRWRACRHGVEGELLDLGTGERMPARTRLHRLLDALEPVAERLDCAAELASARRLVEVSGAMALRAAAGRDGDPRRATEWLANRFLDECP
ncbi:MAG: glutamate---cysteine ligase / carboxylate-amine ligase [Solirubrobacteraceae bacterium]|nr:glutamate---cysteine ligase / carboxylate-amine ligase [Solirubrobacteraceae bacterium]